MFRIFVLSFASWLVYLATAGPVKEYALPASPCPEILKYDYIDGHGRLDASLFVQSPHVLNGLWIRLVFDRDIDELKVKDDFGQVERKTGTAKIDFLIKNPSTILQSNERRVLQISVKYSGGDVPNIIEYRINAVTVCPNARSSGQVYPNDEEVPSSYLPSLVSDSQPLPSQTDCGLSQSPDFHPWQAAIFTKVNNTEHYTCEATLVSPRHLLTAAHCVTFLRTRYSVSSSSLKIYFGKYSLDQPDTPYLVKRVVVYPGFEPVNLLNDIAIIELADTGDKQIIPVCLATEEASKSIQSALTGYQIENNAFTKAGTAVVERVDDGHCSANLTSFLGDGNYCATYLKGNQGCVGDSGSASLLNLNDKWFLQGILNVGPALQSQQKCDDSSTLIFTEVYQYSKWIKAKLAEEI